MVRFLFDPATDVDEVRYSTLLNHDETVPADADLGAPKDTKPKTDTGPNNAERNRIADLYPDRLVIFINSGNQLVYDDALQRWALRPRDNYWSNGTDRYVTMIDMPTGDVLAHEIGNNLHLVHTLGYVPSSVQEFERLVIGAIRSGVMASDVPSALFDWDQFVSANDVGSLPVLDTPPDPGPSSSPLRDYTRFTQPAPRRRTPRSICRSHSSRRWGRR
jgi:hypothetical protein